MTACHGCQEPLEPLAQVRQYHTSCDPMGRVQMLERAIHKHRLDTWGIGSVEHPNDAELYDALVYRPAQMKGREG